MYLMATMEQSLLMVKHLVARHILWRYDNERIFEVYDGLLDKNNVLYSKK